MHDRTGWVRGHSGRTTIKGREYKDLTEFTRPCAACQQPFSIFVTSKIADGNADSNSFGLKNCEDHRRNKAGPASEETEALRMSNRVMKEELAGLYARDKDLFAENQALKARLASYELQGAMALVTQEQADAAAVRVLNGGPVSLEYVTAQNKMPWEQNSS